MLFRSYQWLGNRANVFTLNASLMHEGQSLGASVAAGSASTLHGGLSTARLAASYHFQQTWGVSGSLFAAHGNTDPALWGGVSYNARPDTAGYILQADWTPWGKEDSWGAPWANLRLGLQYTAYNRYNGGRHYIDDVNGVDRRASDNNTTLLFAWWSL